MITFKRAAQANAVRGMESACSLTHVFHKGPGVPMSWFEPAKYATWRGRVCHLLYGCPLTTLSWKLQERWSLTSDEVWGEAELALWTDYDAWGRVVTNDQL